MPSPTINRQRQGLLYGLAAYTCWGLVPLYFKSISHVWPLEVLAHRIVWSVLLLVVLLTCSKRWPEVGRCFRSRALLPALMGSTLLIAINWFVYIYGVSSKQVLQTSLGYFMNPLVSIVLGMVVFGERLRPRQWLAVLLGIAGVINLAFGMAAPPWIAVTLALSFGLYGLMRKVVPVDALIGISVETFLLVPLAAAFLQYRAATGAGAWRNTGSATDLLLATSGVVTAVPLLWFGRAARLLPLSMLGFLQYLSPSLAFILAIAVFREPFSTRQLISFACIWTALGFYSLDSLLTHRRRASRSGADDSGRTGPPRCAQLHQKCARLSDGSRTPSGCHAEPSA